MNRIKDFKSFESNTPKWPYDDEYKQIVRDEEMRKKKKKEKEKKKKKKKK